MWSLFAKHKPPDERTVALTVAVVFVLSGAVWVSLTDLLLYATTRDPVLVARLETMKGWTFVLLWAGIVYWATLRSVARLARARAAIAAVVNSIADGLLLLDSDRRIRQVNPAATAMLRSDDLVGMNAAEFVRRFRVSRLDGSLVPPTQLISQRVFEEGGTLHYKAVLHPPDSAEVVISATAAAVRVAVEQPPEMVVSVMHDISDSEHLERLRDQFFAAAAHSLKTPVSIIKITVQSLSAGDSLRTARSIAVVERQCDRIDRLVRNMLVLARARSMTLKLHTSEVPVETLVEGVACRMTKATRRHDVHVKVESPVRIHGDRQQLELALSDVIDTACRSSPSDSAVTVLVRRDGGRAEIGVRYTPLPLEETMVDAEGEYDEIGINRMVAETIVAAHGGDLSREQTNSEAIVWIRLPETREAPVP
jgi:signal transduction histidine kinase